MRPSATHSAPDSPLSPPPLLSPSRSVRACCTPAGKETRHGAAILPVLLGVLSVATNDEVRALGLKDLNVLGLKRSANLRAFMETSDSWQLLMLPLFRCVPRDGPEQNEFQKDALKQAPPPFPTSSPLERTPNAQLPPRVPRKLYPAS